MDSDGNIRRFMSDEEARRAGFDTPLSEDEATHLGRIEKSKRRAELHRMRRSRKAREVEIENMSEPELAELMNLLARQVGQTCKARHVEPPKFALLLFNDPAVAQYVANCDRSDIIEAMRECADRLEQKQDVPR